MATCDVCGKNQSIKLLADIHFCKDCWGTLAKLRSGNEETIDYYASSRTSTCATDKASEYFFNQASYFSSKFFPDKLTPYEKEQQEKEQAAREAAQAAMVEAERNAERVEELLKKIFVTTCDLKQDYEVIGPVYFQVSNKGLFGSALGSYIQKYEEKIQEMRLKGTMSGGRADWGFIVGEWSVGQNDFEKAFFIATEELKKRAAILGADAIIGMRQDIDMDTDGFAYFYLQMYGTAVKFK